MTSRRRTITPRRRRCQFERLEDRCLLAADPIINEFLASNHGVIADQDGDFSDFIELYNRGDTSANLGGWYLTDDHDDLTKWQIPAVNLDPGQYLVVFASGKDRAIAGSQLHTNFSISVDGEYLGLIKPDGVTSASEFFPEFPPQREDISYGVGSTQLSTQLIAQGTAAKVLVPSSGGLGTTWTAPAFVPDVSWQSGALGFGFSPDVTPPVSTTVLQVDFNSRGSSGTTQSGFSSFVIGGSSGTIQTGSITRTFGSLGVTVADASGVGFDDRLRSTPTNSGAFTESLLLRDFVFSRANTPGGGMDVSVTGLVPSQIYTFTVWSFDSGSTSQRTSDWTANGQLAALNYSFNGSSLPVSNDTYKFAVVVAADATGKVTLQGRNDEAMNNFAVFVNALKVETGDTISPPPSAASVLRVDFNSRTGGESGSANTEAGYATMSLDTNGSTFSTTTFTLSAYNGSVLGDQDHTAPADSGAFTLDQIYDDIIYSTGAAGSGMQILVSGLAPNAQYDVVLRSYDALAPTTRSANWSEVTSGQVLAAPYSFNGSVAPASNDAYAIRATLTSSLSGTLVLRGVQTDANRSVVVNSLELTRGSFDPVLGLDIQTSMLNHNSSGYVRVPFTVNNLAAVDQLFLDMQYDSGFVAYLNGQEVARRNAPTAAGVPPAYNAAAVLERSVTEALTAETIDISQFANLLVAGSGNVLAIHGLNSSASNNDFLILPKLRSEEISGQNLRYFTTPTPGAANGAGVFDFVSDVDLSHDHDFYNAPFQLTLQTPTADASIYYTFNGSAPSPTNAAAQLYSSSITINRTTMFRAAAFKTGLEPSPVSTQTYIFLEDVLTQTISTSNPASNPFGLSYPALWQANAPADFNMDPDVVAQWDDNNPSNTDYGIREALLSLPTMSIVMDQYDLWDGTNGIYNNATSLGDAWRRPGSIEYLDPATGETFQYNVGIQMHGDASRDNVRTKKHSFRLIFNPEFDGPGRLEFPLFDNTDFADINTVVMRASFTDSFATRTQTSRYTPIIATYMRDVWMRDSQVAMGHYSASSTYVNLYVNGLYWGVYNPAERVDDASLASHLGGVEEDWDIIRDFNELHRGNADAWNAMYSLARTITSASDKNAVYWQLQGRNPDGTVNAALPVYLDVENFIDYIVLHLYAGVEDWPSHNWLAGRNRVNPGEGFQFFTWDQEIALDSFFRDRTEVNNSYTPAELYSLLRNSSEFKLRFADRVEKFLFNGGALTTAENQERWNARADQIEAAIIGESARWGDAREGEVVNVPPTVTVPVMTVNEWRANIADVNGYFDQNRSLALSRFTADGLFPTLGAPMLNQFGGEVDPGFQLTMSLAAGSPGGTVIYYTLDGSDPRLPGGGIRPGALVYSGPLTLNDPTHIMARSLSDSTWSPLIDSTTLIAIELAGDYDGSLVVDQADYDVWRSYFGATSGIGLQADGNHNGVVDAADYAIWRKNLGRSSIGYSFNTIGQTYTQNFNFFQGTQPTLPVHFTFTADSGTDIFRGIFNSTTSSAPSFTGVMAATSDGLNNSIAWRESTGSATLADGRLLFALTNNTNQPITAFNFSYDVEAWVNGRRDNQVRFKYDIYANNTAAQAAAGRDAFLTDVAATLNPNHTPIANNTDEFVLDGKAATNRVTVTGTVDLTTLLIDTATPGLGTFGALQSGQTAYFRWQISNASLNNGNRSALGLDNFSLTPLASAAGQGSGLGSATSSPATAPAALPPKELQSLALESFRFAPTLSTRRATTTNVTPFASTQSSNSNLLLAIATNSSRPSDDAPSSEARLDEPSFDLNPQTEDFTAAIDFALAEL